MDSKPLNCIILTKNGEVTGNFSNLQKALNSKGIEPKRYNRKKFPFVLEETGEKVWKLPRL